MRSSQGLEHAAGSPSRSWRRSSIQSRPSTFAPSKRSATGPRAPPGVAGGDFDNGPVSGRGEDRVDLGRVRLALQPQRPTHDVDALRVPAGVDAEEGGTPDGRRLPRRRRFGDAPLDVGAGAELTGLIDGLGEPEGPRAGGDRHGQGLGVAEGAPFGSGVPERANLVSCVDAHRLLRVGRIARPRETPSRGAGLAPRRLGSGSFACRPAIARSAVLRPCRWAGNRGVVGRTSIGAG